MKKLTKTIVSLAIVATYAAIGTPSASAEDWSLKSGFTAPGTFDGAGKSISPNAQTTVWKMDKMNLAVGETGTINKFGDAATNVYALIDGGKTTWEGKLNAPGVNFAAFNNDGFFIGSSGVVNANALMLSTAPLNQDSFTAGKWVIDNKSLGSGAIQNMGHINADAVILAANKVVNNAEVLVNGERPANTGIITGTGIRIAAGDNISLNIDPSQLTENSTIADALVDPGFKMGKIGTAVGSNDNYILVDGTSGVVFNDGQILSDAPSGVGIGIVAAGNGQGSFTWGNAQEYQIGYFTKQDFDVDGPDANIINLHTEYTNNDVEKDNYSQISTVGSDIELNSIGSNIANKGYISTLGVLKDGVTGKHLGYKIITPEGGDGIRKVDKDNRLSDENALKNSKLKLNIDGGKDVKLLKTPDIDSNGDITSYSPCYDVRTGNINLNVDGDYTIGPDSIIGDSHVSILGTDPIVVDSTGTVKIDAPPNTDSTGKKPGDEGYNPDVWNPGNDLKIEADDDIINNTPIQTDDKLIFDADRDIINNDPITVDGDGQLDWDAGRDIVNNDTITLDDGASADWDAGRNIVNNTADPNGNPYQVPGQTPGNGSIINNGTGPIDFTTTGKDKDGNNYDDGGDIINKGEVTLGPDNNAGLDWDAARDIVNDTTGTITNNGTGPLDFTSGNNPDLGRGDIINNNDITSKGKLPWVAARDIINNDKIELTDEADADWKAGRNIVNNSKDNPYGDNPNSKAGDGTITGGTGSDLNFKTGVDKDGNPVNTYPDGGDIINKHQVTNGGTANWDAGRNVINDTTGTIDNSGEFKATSGNNPNATADADGNNGDIINKHLIQNDGGAISLEAGRNVINDTTGVIQTKPGSTKDGTIHLTSGNKTPGDVINDGKINLTKDSLKAVADAGNVINNGEFTSTSPNGTVDLEAKKGTGANAGKGGYVIQNGTVDLTNGGKFGGTGEDKDAAVKIVAGKSIITTDAESYDKLKADGIKVRPDANGKRDVNGNAVTKIAPANNGILAKAADDIINNGITALKTNTGADMNLEATKGYIIQNNELAAKSGGKMKFKAGQDIITTDTNSRAKLNAAGVDPNIASPDLAYVSSSIVGPVADKNGNSITSLQTITPGDGSTPSMVLEAAKDVINNGITTIDAPDPNVKAGRHAIQNNILSFINPNKAKIEAGVSSQGDVIDGVGANRANIAGKSNFVSTNVVGDGSAKSITNIVATDETATPELEMIAGNGGSVTTQGLINVDAKNATISTPSNDYNILGEINANTAFTLPDVDDPNVTYIFDNNSAYGSVDKARHPETTKGLLNLVAENNDINGNGANIHGYDVYLNAPSANGDINLANGATAEADNIMSTYSNKLTIDDTSSIIGDYTQVRTKADMTLNGNTGSSFRLDRVAGKKELTVLSDGNVNVTGDTTLGDNSALNVADTADKVTVAGTDVTVNPNAKLTLKTTADGSAGYVYATNKVDNKGAIDFAKGGKIAGDTVDVSGKVKAGKDLGIFSKKGQTYTGADLEAENILLQTDSTVDFTATNKADFHSGFVASEGENYSNTLSLTDTKANATTGYLHMYAGDITASDATKAEATQFASAGETVLDAKSGALNITKKIVKAGNGLIGKAKTTVDVNNSDLTATAGDIALTAGGKATVQGGSTVDAKAGKTTITGEGVDVIASTVKASDLNTLEAGTGDLILDGANATGGSLIGKGKNVISQNNKSTLKATAENGTIDLTADNNATFNADVDFDAPTTNVVAAETITNNKNLKFKGNLNLNAKKVDFTNQSSAKLADGSNGALKIVATGTGVAQDFNGTELKADDIYLKAEGGKINISSSDIEAKNHMSTRSKTIDFGANDKIKGDKTTISTIEDLNVKSKVDHVKGTTELTMHSDADVIVDGDVTLKSNNKATLAAGNYTFPDEVVSGSSGNVIIQSGKQVTFDTAEGEIFANNKVINNGHIVFKTDGEITAGTVEVDNGSINAGNDLKVYAQDHNYTNADIEANKDILLSAHNWDQLQVEESADGKYIRFFGAAGPHPNCPIDCTSGDIIMNGNSINAKTGVLEMMAGNIDLSNATINSGLDTNIKAFDALTFNKTTSTSGGDMNLVAGGRSLEDGNLTINDAVLTSKKDINASAALDIKLANTTANADNKINLDAGRDLIFDNAVVTAEGKNLPTTGDRDAVVGLARRDVYLKGGNTKITAKDGNLVLKADSGHYGETLADGTADRSPNATGGVIFNQTGKGLKDTLYTTQNSDKTWKGYWNIFSNDEETADGAERKAAAQALKDDPTLYVYDKNNPNYRIEKNRTVFYDDRRNKADEQGNDPYDEWTPPTPPPTPSILDDSRLIQSAAEQPEEKTVWKRFDNHVDQTKLEVNSSVNRYIQSGDQYIDALGQPMINGVSEVQKDEHVGYYDDEE